MNSHIHSNQHFNFFKGHEGRIKLWTRGITYKFPGPFKFAHIKRKGITHTYAYYMNSEEGINAIDNDKQLYFNPLIHHSIEKIIERRIAKGKIIQIYIKRK